jgi:hypothetical protein
MGDIPTILSKRWDVKIGVSGDTDEYGGYEIDKPITPVTKPLNKNRTTFIDLINKKEKYFKNFLFL